jgi:tetratricopeptide (TPR) repeat protein
MAAAAIAGLLSFAHVTRERAVMRANVGNMFLLRGRYEEALAEFEAVRAARPAAWRVEIGIATAQARLGRTEAALRTLDSVLGKLRAEERSTGRVPKEELLICYTLAGDLELNAGRPLRAAENYRDALELAPGQPALISKLSNAEATADSVLGEGTTSPPTGPR